MPFLSSPRWSAVIAQGFAVPVYKVSCSVLGLRFFGRGHGRLEQCSLLE
jgi:hypothetical protein